MTEQPATEHISTISELLKRSGSQYRLYDVGRLVTKLDKTTFEKVELNQLPYPTPIQGHACLAIVFWQKNQKQPYLWIVKLPLDERGLLNQGARNHFIAIIIEALGNDLTQTASKKQEELLASNPYLFTPAQYKMASLNSKIKVDLKQPESEHYLPFKEYLSDSNNLHNWQTICIQGITDFIAKINQDDNSELLQTVIPMLPLEVLSPVCSALENEKFDVELLKKILSMFTDVAKDLKSPPTAGLLLRAVAANSDNPLVKSAVNSLLEQSKLPTEYLIILSGRCWLALADEAVLIQYFELLLSSKEPELFSNIFKDLVSIPSIRPIVFQCIRSDKRSPALAQAIGQLFA